MVLMSWAGFAIATLSAWRWKVSRLTAEMSASRRVLG
jgi:hypothetical protein